MPKRQDEDELWKKHKEKICQLYERESRPLSSVREYMVENYGFDRTYVYLSIYCLHLFFKKEVGSQGSYRCFFVVVVYQCGRLTYRDKVMATRPELNLA
jgi:hypothetical protein